ncbi:LLM class flavin-dependent oxidoreductase [Actinoplanes sp. N902-109]|uniref:LLM class flavin-dependent oxidoreductase n=1 Tax=Actinoplanes sp. (strain N902-109) TaxID=649831 RepID=UPI0003295ACB|nr:LLM class flavin-dependent oxidoreductase [Actinoplanes sp. N902-109]AGL19748.1 F420-dependent reductase [Actinoplanes sp. N902-109]
MDLGLGLPVSHPARLPDWARRAESCGFDSLALLDRLVYDNPEPLIALSVLAGATSRIRLQSEVLLGPLRQTPLLAKQVATLDRMSGGRFVLGIGIGGRADDHAAAGVPLAGRGDLLDRQLTDLRRIWRAGSIGPRPATAGGPELLIGAFAPVALRRIARHGAGFLCAAPLSWAGPLVRSVQDDWAAAGRPGRPRLVCQINVAVGAAVQQARAAVADYYAFTGRPGFGEPLTDPAQIADTIAAYRDFGADELVLYCYGDDPDQVDQLAQLRGSADRGRPARPRDQAERMAGGVGEDVVAG